MKHVFVVQSHITYLAALGVIAKQNMELQNVLILSEAYVREQPVKVQTVDLYQSFFKMLFAPKNYFNISRKTDKILARFLEGDFFELYVPVLTNLARIVFTNPKCISLNFIEEGVSSYHRAFDIDTIITYYRNYNNRPAFNKKYLSELKTGIVMALRGASPKMLAFPIFYQAYTDSPNVKFFGFDQDCYPLCAQTEVISFEKINQKFKFETQYELNNCAIWVGDDCVSCANYPINDYIEGIKKGFVDKIDRNLNVFIKFHPSEQDISRMATLELLNQNNIKFQVIPDEVILEMEIIGSNNVNLYGTYSSLLIYGGMMGCTSYTVQNYLKNPFAITVPLFEKLVVCS